jgi:hypothetical protein
MQVFTHQTPTLLKIKNKTMKHKILFLLLFGFTSFIHTQEKINQLDENGKKHGKWKVYLETKAWKAIDDSTKAEYYKFTYYDHGINLYPMGPCGKADYTLIVPGGETSEKGRLKPVHGEYKWIDKKGRISSIQIFDKGNYLHAMEYRKSGALEQHFDYTKKAEGQNHGWTLFQYNKKGQLYGTYLFSKKDGKWALREVPVNK